MQTNCKNCGAPVAGGVCEYCGTPTDRFAQLAIGKPLSVRFEAEGVEYEFEMLVENFNLDSHADYQDLYTCEGRYFTCLTCVDYRSAFSGRVLTKDGVAVRVKTTR